VSTIDEDIHRLRTETWRMEDGAEILAIAKRLAYQLAALRDAAEKALTLLRKQEALTQREPCLCLFRDELDDVINELDAARKEGK
jgi:hypothetical protein